MRKLMVLVVLLAVALIAAPAIAQNEESTTPDTPNGGPPSNGAGASLPEPPISDPPAEEPPVPETPAPEPPAQKNTPPEAPVLESPVSDPPAPEPPAQKHEGPVSDTNADDPSPTPGDFTSTGSDVADGPDGRTRDNTDEITKDEIADDDEVDAEAREDRLADRILAQLRDGKKDDEDEDEDDANEDDVEQSQDQDADSGDADQDADVINTGDNVNQCVGILQVANTGNAQNATGVTQYDSEADEVELEDGSRITLTPQLVVDCRQIILQIVRGERPNESKISKAGLREVIRPTRGATLAARTGAGVIVPSSRSGITATPKVLSASSAGRPAGQPRTSARSLPRTGGSYATLVGLGTGALLVGGGLLVRRLAR
jgi:outer membrane biosynthesis protein TonB